MPNLTVIGVYSIPQTKDAHLVECRVDATAKEVDFLKIRQSNLDLDPLSEQVPYDEHYLDETGQHLLVPRFQAPPSATRPLRISFFLHFIDFSKPLQTQFGSVPLPKPEAMPARLSDLITYEEVD